MPVHLQMNRQPSGKSGFAAGGWPGQQHHMLVLLMNLPGNFVDCGFMQRLIHPDKMAQLMILNHAAQVAHVGYTQDFAPRRTLGKHLQVLRPVDIRRGMVKVRPGRQLQHKAAAQLKHRENPHIAG